MSYIFLCLSHTFLQREITTQSSTRRDQDLSRKASRGSDGEVRVGVKKEQTSCFEFGRGVAGDGRGRGNHLPQRTHLPPGAAFSLPNTLQSVSHLRTKKGERNSGQLSLSLFIPAIFSQRVTMRSTQHRAGMSARRGMGKRARGEIVFLYWRKNLDQKKGVLEFFFTRVFSPICNGCVEIYYETLFIHLNMYLFFATLFDLVDPSLNQSV